MGSRRIEPVRVLTCVEQQLNDVSMAVLGGPREGAMPNVYPSRGQRPTDVLGASQGSGSGEIECRAAENQRINGFKLPMSQRRSQSARRVGAVVTQEID